MLDAQVAHEALDVSRCVALLVLRTPVVQLQTCVRQHHALRPEQASDSQVQFDLVVQARALRGDLVEQDSPDAAGSDYADRKSVRREVEASMHGT